MKQNTLHIAIISLGASMMLSACSSNDDSLSGGETTRYAITFGANDGQLQSVTRATSNSPLGNSYTEMKVYGYKTVNDQIQNIMPGYTMKYDAASANSSTTNSSGWEYVGQGTDYLGLDQEIKYWDGNSTDYRFFGVLSSGSLKYKANSSATASDIDKTTNVTTDGVFELSFTGLSYMTRNKKDDGSTAYYDASGNEVDETKIPIYCHLWQGNPSGTTGSSSAANYTQPVTLEFVKPYSLVRLVFERPAGSTTTQLGNPAATDDNYNISFAPVSGNIAGNGDVTITYPMTGSEETYATTNSGTTTLSKMSLGTLTLENQDERYQAWPEYVMVPTTTQNGAFKCTAYIYTANTSSSTGGSYTERTAIVPAQYMQWKPGYQYTYVFKVTANSGLEFSHVVEVYTKWQAGYVSETVW